MTSINLQFSSETETRRFGEDLALAMRRGDFVTLSGDLGAGKTSLVRALIRAAANDGALEVPSPTFTLVQSYDGMPFGGVAHIDLYRLESSFGIDELGLDDSLDEGIVVLEWPEKAEDTLSGVNLEIKMSADAGEEERSLTISGEPEAIKRVRRTLEIRRFLDANGFANSRRAHLTGDASTRAYETIYPESGQPIILMNAPGQPDGPPIRDGKPYSQIARLAEDMRSFVGVGQTLKARGFRTPEIHAHDLDAGLLLIEDLGDGSVITKAREPIRQRYLASMETLAAIHGQTWQPDVSLPDGSMYTIPVFDREAMLIEVDLLPDWYAPFRLGRPLNDDERSAFNDIWNRLIDGLRDAETSLLLRDFHSPNIIWCDEAEGNDRVGLIDFQDALIGPTAYDVACIAQDARVDVSADLEKEMVDHYCELRHVQGSFDETSYRTAYAIMAAQRATKVAGIFVRLSERDGKADYLAHLPRMEDYLKRSFAHSALADYASWVKTILAQ